MRSLYNPLHCMSFAGKFASYSVALTNMAVACVASGSQLYKQRNYICAERAMIKAAAHFTRVRTTALGHPVRKIRQCSMHNWAASHCSLLSALGSTGRVGREICQLPPPCRSSTEFQTATRICYSSLRYLIVLAPALLHYLSLRRCWMLLSWNGVYGQEPW